MPAPPDRFLTARREALASQLRLRGWTEDRIADRLEAEGLGRVTQQAVSAMLDRVERRVREGMVEHAAAVKVRQLQALSHIEEEALDAWHKSKDGYKKLAEKTVQPQPPAPVAAGQVAPAPRPGRTEKTMEVEAKYGEAAYLGAAMAAGDRIRKVLGLDAPTRVRHGGDAEGPPIAVEHSGAVALTLSHLTDDQLEQADALGDLIAAGAAPSADGQAHEHHDPR